MTKPVEVLSENDSIMRVAHLFNEKHIGAAAVLDSLGKPVGVITKTDIIHYEEERDGLQTVDKSEFRGMNGDTRPSGYHLMDDDAAVRNWMTPVIFTVKPETPMKEVARRMVRYGIHHIFIQNDKQRDLLGIVSSFDVLRYVASE
jgi:predicted transcriptional regulator